MKIFISWSGAASRELARILKEWLPTVLPYARPWLSSDDIRKGKPWDAELTKQLEATSYCLVCVTTKEVAEAPWVNFEAGAVSKYVERAHVSPLLVNVRPKDLDGVPLARFQCTQFNKTDVESLLLSVNEAAETPLSGDQLSRNLRNTWSQLKNDVEGLDLSDEWALPQDDDRDNDHKSDATDGGPVQAEDTNHHAIVSSVPVAEGLAQYEIDGLVIVTEEVDAKINIYEFYLKMKRAGFKKLEATLAQKALISRGMLKAFRDETYTGETYDALQVTPQGIAWLLENQGLLSTASEANATIALEDVDDDLPF